MYIKYQSINQSINHTINRLHQYDTHGMSVSGFTCWRFDGIGSVGAGGGGVNDGGGDCCRLRRRRLTSGVTNNGAGVGGWCARGFGSAFT